MRSFITWYFSPNIIRIIKSRRMGCVGHVARMRETKNAYRILMGKPEGKRSLGRPRGRWVDNIKIHLRDIGCDGMDWIDLAQDQGPVEGSCEHGDEPSGSLKMRGSF
jgi:hypothetical protein